MTLREFGLRFAAKHGIRPLRPGERRPVGFYMVDHYTGVPLIADRNAVVPLESRDGEVNADSALVERDQ